MYPPDGGLPKQVKKFEDTFSMVDLIKKHFKIEDQQNGG